jgi:cytochrome c oxidase assembly factor CtaG
MSIIRIVTKSQRITTLADDFLALDALLFLVSCILFYWAMRRVGLSRMHRIERIADFVFIVAPVLMVVICLLITFEISY